MKVARSEIVGLLCTRLNTVLPSCNFFLFKIEIMSQPSNDFLPAYTIVTIYKPVTICTDKNHTLYQDDNKDLFCPLCHPPF